MNQESTDFKERVFSIVASIPPGRVMTYGQVAALAGSPRAARIVGVIAHYGDSELPWHRIVNRNGGLASGYPGGRQVQKVLLESEDIIVSVDYYLKLDDYLFR